MESTDILTYIAIIILAILSIFFYRRMKQAEINLDTSKKENENIISSKEVEFTEKQNLLIEEQEKHINSIIDGKYGYSDYCVEL